MSKLGNDLFKDYVDSGYIDFKRRVTKTKKKVAGIRMKDLYTIRNYIKKNYEKNVLEELDYETIEETNLYFLLISDYYKGLDFIKKLKENIKYCDSWETTDTLVTNSKFVKKDIDFYYPHFLSMLESEYEYEVRIAIVFFLEYYIDSKYIENIIIKTLNIKRSEYYIKMAIAWLYSFIYIKRPEAIIKYFSLDYIEYDIFKMAIRKCLDSYRITDDQKELLKKLNNGLKRN